MRFFKCKDAGHAQLGGAVLLSNKSYFFGILYPLMAGQEMGIAMRPTFSSSNSLESIAVAFTRSPSPPLLSSRPFSSFLVPEDAENLSVSAKSSAVATACNYDADVRLQ